MSVPLVFGSICSGIEAASVAWNPLGWRCAFASEVAPFPRAVLRHRHPETPLHGDFTTIEAGHYAALDVLVGGTPCQSFSIAGLRKGMADERGNLALEYLRLAHRLRPRWLVWENVPGVLSSNGGRDFGSFLGGLGQLGYGFAYRVLDAQYFGLAQRRKRVFVVGYLGDWRRAAAVLFEPQGLRGDPAPRRKAGERVATPIASGSPAGSGYRNDADTADNLVSGGISPALRARHNDAHRADTMAYVAFGGNKISGPIEVATAVNAHGGPMGRMDFASETFVAHSLRGEGFDASEDGTGRGTPIVPIPFDTTQITSRENRSRPEPGDPCHPIAASAHAPAIAFDCKASGQSGFGVGDIAATMRAMGHADSHQNGGGHQAALTGSTVRRLTPRECERLQGFNDDYTLIPWRNGLAPDGPRYKALGNSMAVPVMAWIGRRIATQHEVMA